MHAKLQPPCIGSPLQAAEWLLDLNELGEWVDYSAQVVEEQAELVHALCK